MTLVTNILFLNSFKIKLAWLGMETDFQKRKTIRHQSKQCYLIQIKIETIVITNFPFFNPNLGGLFTRSSFWGRGRRNSEIGNSPVWFWPNIWRLGLFRDTKFGKNTSNEMLLNAAKWQGHSFYRFWVIQGKPTEGER